MSNQKFLFFDANGIMTEDAISVSSYSGSSADRLVRTDGTGKIDNSLINFAAFNNVFAVRAASSTNLTLSAPGTTVGGVTMSSGDRFLAYGQTDQTENGIYVWNGAASAATRATDYNEDAEVSAGDLIVVAEGTAAEQAFILATNNPIVLGTSNLVFSPLGQTIAAAGAGLSYAADGKTLNVNLLSAGGLKFVGDDISIEPADFAGTGLQDDGSDNLEIDFADPATEMNTTRAVKASDLFNSGANQGAKILGFDNTAVSAYTSATKIQGALEDAYSFAAAPGVLYTVGAGGVTKGDLVYVSANNTVLPYSDISIQRNIVGIAASTVAAAGTVKVLIDSTVLSTVLSSATAGNKYYWNGTTLVSTIPSGLGNYIWEAGVARNASDLHCNVLFLRRNSLI